MIFNLVFLIDVAKSVHLPVMVGSGVTTDNVADYAKAHALIVGSHFKSSGRLRSFYFDK